MDGKRRGRGRKGENMKQPYAGGPRLRAAEPGSINPEKQCLLTRMVDTDGVTRGRGKVK